MEWTEQVLSYSAVVNNGKLDMEERGEKEDLNLVYLLHWPTCFSGRLGQPVPRQCSVSEEKNEGTNLSGQLDMDLQKRLHLGFGLGRKEEDLQLPYLLPCLESIQKLITENLCGKYTDVEEK